MYRMNYNKLQGNVSPFMNQQMTLQRNRKTLCVYINQFFEVKTIYEFYLFDPSTNNINEKIIAIVI